MTNRELIEVLGKLPPDSPVFMYDGEYGDYSRISGAELKTLFIDGDTAYDRAEHYLIRRRRRAVDEVVSIVIS